MAIIRKMAMSQFALFILTAGYHLAKTYILCGFSL